MEADRAAQLEPSQLPGCDHAIYSVSRASQQLAYVMNGKQPVPLWVEWFMIHVANRRH